MANYAIRVELKGNPSYQTYQTLHALMARMRFYQSVNGVDMQGAAKQFDLPHAVYFGSSVSDCSSVMQNVVTAVKSEVQPDILVFVVQSSTWSIGS